MKTQGIPLPPRHFESPDNTQMYLLPSHNVPKCLLFLNHLTFALLLAFAYKENSDESALTRR